MVKIIKIIPASEIKTFKNRNKTESIIKLQYGRDDGSSYSKFVDLDSKTFKALLGDGRFEMNMDIVNHFHNKLKSHRFFTTDFIKIAHTHLEFARMYRYFDFNNYKGVNDFLLFQKNTISKVVNLVSKDFRKNGLSKFILFGKFRFESIGPSKKGEKIDNEIYVNIRSPSNDVINDDDYISRNTIGKMFEYIYNELEIFETNGSGWRFKNVVYFDISFSKYNPLKGSSYIELPKELADKKAIINIKNDDNKCFLWSVLASLYPVDRKKYPNKVHHYKKYEHEFKADDFNYPMKIGDIPKFEERFNISINVFGYSDKMVFPIYNSDKKFKKVVDLLLLESDGNNHYCLINNLSRLVRAQITRHDHNSFICRRCLYHTNTQEILDKHTELCQNNEVCKCEMPKKGETMKFKNHKNKVPIPFVIYADFEAILPSISGCSKNPSNSYTEKTEAHQVCGFAYKVVCCLDDSLSKDLVIYRGPNADKIFIEKLKREQKEILEMYENPKKMILSAEDKKDFKNAKVCWLCEKELKNDRVCDHCHITGKYRGASHNDCNLLARVPRFIPVIFHNLKGYDSHIILKNLDTYCNVKCIPNNEEKYITFDIGKLKFIDSFSFMASSLDALTENLKTKGAENFKYTKKYFGENLDLMLRKGIYFYEYIKDFGMFHTPLPDNKDAFYSSLNDSHISDEDFEHYKKVADVFKIETCGEYHDLYLSTDVLLLADIFENFRAFCLDKENYNLDPCYYLTLPGFAWDAMMKMTGVHLELLYDYDMWMFFEKQKRGGISVISHRYAKANNPYLVGYDKNKETTYIMDWDANNLYGTSMSMKLPYKNFKWVDVEKFTPDFILSYDDESNIGYSLEVDLDYPRDLHHLHNDYPLAPELLEITSDILSDYTKARADYLFDTLGKRNILSTKLCPNLLDKKNYVVDIRNLKYYLSHGLKLSRVHKVIQYEQMAWLKPFIDFNTNKRKNAKDDFEKNLFKKINNSVYGKTIENVRGRINFQIKNLKNKKDQKAYLRLVNKNNFKRDVIFNKYIVGVHMNKTKVKLNKPIYAGTAILDLSKLIMYRFHYDFIINKYGYENVKLLATDTDSLKYLIKTEDIYNDQKENNHLFDLSEYPGDHPCYDPTNKKVLGKFKDECNGLPISEFIGLRAKMYAQTVGNDTKKRAKGIKIHVVKNNIDRDNYYNALFNNQINFNHFKQIRSFNHEIFTTHINKIGLCSYDDKRYILDDGINTRAHGHYLNNKQ